MSETGRCRLERRLALVVVAIAGAACAWLHLEAGRVETVTAERRELLARLRSVAAPGPASGGQAADLEVFVDLFPGHRLEWGGRQAAAFLALRAADGRGGA